MAEAREKGRQGGLSPNEIYQQACGSASAAGITLGHTKNALDKRVERERQKQNPLPPNPTTFEEARAWMLEEMKKTEDGEDWLAFEGTRCSCVSFLHYPFHDSRHIRRREKHVSLHVPSWQAALDARCHLVCRCFTIPNCSLHFEQHTNVSLPFCRRHIQSSGSSVCPDLHLVCARTRWGSLALCLWPPLCQDKAPL